MERKVLLDSDIAIEILRDNQDIIKKILTLEARFYTTSVNVFELWSGRSNDKKMEEFLSSFQILEFDKESAIISGNIRKELKKKGTQIDFRDLFVASICIKNDIEFFTHNIKHFQRLQGYGLKLIK